MQKDNSTEQKLLQRESELAVINSVQSALAANMTLEDIYTLVGEKLRNLFDAQVTGIYTFDQDANLELFEYLYEDGERLYPESRPLNHIRKWLIEHKEVLHVSEDADNIIHKLTGEEHVAVPGTRLPKAMIFVPLMVGNEVVGCVSLQNLDRENAFSESDVQLLSTLSNSMSVALENARLFNETEQRNAELAVINSVQQGLVAEMDLQGIYDLVGNKIRDLFDSQVTVIATFNEENNTEEFRYVFENGKHVDPQPRPYDRIRKRLIDTKKLINIEENAGAAFTNITGEKPKAAPGTEFPKSMVYVPLLVGDTVQGYVSLQNLDREHAFSKSDVQLLSTLANSMSVALENARLFNETEQRNAELAVINSVQQGLVAEMDIHGIYELVGEKVRQLFDAQGVIIATFDTDQSREIFRYAFDDARVYPEPRPLDKIRQRLLKTKTLINITENAEEAWTTITGESPKSLPGTEFPKSMLFVPLIVGDNVLGYVSLQNNDREYAFSDSDVRLLSTLANSMSVALENARLFNETEQRNAELDVINSVQQGLVAEMDMQGIYDLVGDRIRDLFDAQVTGIVTFDHENKTEKFHYAYDEGERIYPSVRTFDKIREKIINDKAPLLIVENANEIYREILGEKIKPVPGTRLAKSAIYVPLIVGDFVRGYLTLQNNDREHAFTESDLRLLSTLANSMSVALENARLFNETEQRNAELAVINSVQQGLVAEMDMQGIYDLVGDRVRDLFDAQVAGIVTFNHKEKTEGFKYLYEDGQRFQVDDRAYNKVREKIISERTTLLFNEKAELALSEILGKELKPVPGTRVAKSALYVPMIVGNSVRGYVSLQNLDREFAFSESDVSLLNTLVNSMTVALENARLFNETNRLLAETEQRNAELAVINSVQEGLVRVMDMHAIYRLVGNRICEVLNTQTMLIRTFNHKEETETWEYAIENGEQLHVDPRPFIWANKHLIKTKEPLLINESYIETAKKFGDTEQGVSKGLPPKSAIFVPMIVGDSVIGSISLQNVEREQAFTESDLRLLTTLTNSMSVALENARLFNEATRLLSETEQRAAELQTVNNISKAMVSQLEFDALIKLVGEQMRETFKADIVYLAIHDLKTDMLHFPYYYGDEAESRPFGNGITEKIILNKEPLLVNHDIEKTYDEIKAERKGEMVESYLGVPIIAGNKSIGVISVQSKELENRFSESDQRLLTTIAANVGIAMQNAEAYKKLQAALTDLRSAQEQLVQQEKLASLGQLTAGIAHEIKNPLNFVNNFSELSIELVDEVRDEIKSQISEDSSKCAEAFDLLDDIEMNLQKIHEHGTRADSIVKSMLQHSRGGTGKMESTDMNALIKEYVNLTFHGMRASKQPINVDIQLDLDKDIVKIPVIAEDFSRVLVNLCNNAFDAMREKLKADKSKENAFKPKLIARTKLVDNNIHIQIEDNGPGIPDDIKENILQPFFTTKKGTEGTGLGLSITNDIIKAHGGRLEVESKPGENTIITIILNNEN
jgi:GAF domain-containing protein